MIDRLAFLFRIRSCCYEKSVSAVRTNIRFGKLFFRCKMKERQAVLGKFMEHSIKMGFL